MTCEMHGTIITIHDKETCVQLKTSKHACAFTHKHWNPIITRKLPFVREED
eukprot:c27755_g1_i1 orf=3-152(-)